MSNYLPLEVAISTLNDNVYNIKINKSFEYIIIHQVTNNKCYQDFIKKLPDNVKYISSPESGLSKSRNLAINSANKKYLWIMDDDVIIHDKAHDIIFKLLSRYKEAALIAVSHSHKNIDKLKNKNNVYLNRITSASISSIDMIINLELIGEIRFNERFGLGTNYPSGEEYIFSCDLIKKGLKIVKSYSVCTYHPLVTSGLDFYSEPHKLQAKKEMFKMAFGLKLGWVLFYIFLLKKIPIIFKQKALGQTFKSLIKSKNNYE